jgi:predicted transcriptional regulator YdeE
MNYEIVEMKEKRIVGLTARTGNLDPDCQKIIGGLWQDFMNQQIAEAISNKANSFCVGLYSDYNFQEMTYDVTVGCEVTSYIDSEFLSKMIPAGRYAMFSVHGDVVIDVTKAWDTIWKLPLERSFTGDYEEYISNENNIADVKIYIALKN